MSEQNNELTTRVSSDFHFRTKDGYKRPSVSVEYDAPSIEGVVSYLQGDNRAVVDLIMDAVHSVLASHVRSFVDADLEFSQETLEALVAEGKVSLEFIASIPKADRNVLSKEDLENFAKSYISLMPGITGKEVSRIQAAAALYVERFKRAAGDNTVLAILQEQLGVFADNAPAEVLLEHEKVINWAASKLEELLSIKITADAL